MSVARAISIAFSIALGLLWLSCAIAAAGPAHPAATAKSLPRASGQATIYFLRPNGFTAALWGKLSSPEIRIDGRSIGEVVGGTYLVASRPSGHHVLAIVAGPFNADWESEVELAAGQTYYYEIAPQSNGAPGSELVTMLMAGTNGQRLPGHGFGSFSFLSVDAERGHADLASLKNAAH